MLKLTLFEESHYLELLYVPLLSVDSSCREYICYSRGKVSGVIQQLADCEQIRNRLLLLFNGCKVAMQYSPSSFPDDSKLANKELMLWLFMLPNLTHLNKIQVLYDMGT